MQGKEPKRAKQRGRSLRHLVRMLDGLQGGWLVRLQNRILQSLVGSARTIGRQDSAFGRMERREALAKAKKDGASHTVM